MKKSTALILAGVLLLLCAAGFAAYNAWDDHRAGAAAAQVLQQLQVTQVTAPAANTHPTAPRETEPVSTEPPISEPQPTTEPVQPPTEEVDGNVYIGVLSLPTLDLELPVMQDWSYAGMRISPCRYSGSTAEGNLVIIAHNYENHFGRVEQLEEGDPVLYTDMDGNVFFYEVACTEVLNPDQVEEMTAGEYELTLFTCTVGGELRVTVRCSRIGQQ